ncbi:MAG: ferritin-like domain-containing protein [Elainellaceae cyanobacterium]
MQKQLERSPLAPHCPLSHCAPTPASVSATALDFPKEGVGLPGRSPYRLSFETPYATDVSSNLAIPSEPYWDAAHFGLHQVALFRTSTPEEQHAILSRANLALLQEAYTIEKAGMGYMSHMALLAETTQERMIYTLFAADETSHFVQLSPFVYEKPTLADNPFLQLLSEVVEGDNKTVLLFVIQVVLEGWGLTHYRALEKDCRCAPLKQTLHSFLQDESRHHGTGITLFNQAQMSPASHSAIVEILVQFLRMVQMGPQSVVEAIAQVKGHLSRNQKLQIFAELDTENHSGTRLQLLRSLMRGDGAGAIVQDLEDRGAFSPFAASQCV